ncbi:3-deoxy-D-manno-octulosonic acid transferase [Marinilabilia salmonicolor]|jgi:3-deoxy-D-manno-octulosonic-acid transferase|uniref:3-deoxy-D-manno-octulosonic acid transferase n=1 Tax=Marinilabilia salmonicolor TaxID=989 RepID=A0A2T0X629_9BACT|nr:glycosyltransferase N-terminal domain-containing protein [Marinilabilia salmonicolor]PRY94386.1 3-deoxy-D-manno-octulosonic-acid transferase [Marinilabilia salmonicolor]RCW30015.1 3-deoxy-D-manno-octulosonic-acid transferase [Marinilabilia salmonicolor]
MQFLYTIGVRLFSFAVALAAPFNEKAKLLYKGRKEIWQKLSALKGESSVVWIHCASLGEFEQGRPVIEAIRKNVPGKKILLTFFSPSGYEVRKNYDLADVVCYLPADTPRNARRLLKVVQPESAFFVKYEFWPNLFKELALRDIPLYSISSIFRENQVFFKWYGKWFQKSLKAVTHFYVQDETSGKLLQSIGIKNYEVAGDTRFDRVKAIVDAATEVQMAAQFAAGADFVLVAGSTWPPDEDLLCRYINEAPDGVKLIMAPHEVHEGHVQEIEQKLKVPYFRFTRNGDAEPGGSRVLIVDTIGLLSAIYRYGQVAWIGGGFGKGIHNTLEAATYGIPVAFGPEYHKFKEARDLIEVGGGFSVNDYEGFFSMLENFRTNDARRQESGKAAGSYVKSMCGATGMIMEQVFGVKAEV